MVRPYVATMTRSELMALMVGGFATIAGAVLAAFVGMGIDASHLLAASVISAPAALMAAKVMQPEVEVPRPWAQCPSRWSAAPPTRWKPRPTAPWTACAWP